MSSELSFIHLILNASFIVQLVMLLLCIVSVVSWSIIFNKYAHFKKVKIEIEAFEDRFWSAEDLSKLYERISHIPHKKKTGIEEIFESGFNESARLNKREQITPTAVLSGAQRAMRVTVSKQMNMLETHLTFLATVGSTSPYIGLFGTVWGIMNSFRALGYVQQATIAMVAPGISEALIATAMGLFAAIPAVIAYNRYANDVEQISNRYDNFAEEFSSILHRHIHD